MKSDLVIHYVNPYQHAAATDTPLLVQAGETLLYGWEMVNNEAAASYLRLFNAAAAADVTLGTTAPDYVITTAASVSTARTLNKPLRFSLGLVIGSCTTATGSGHTGASQDVSLEIT